MWLTELLKPVRFWLRIRGDIRNRRSTQYSNKIRHADWETYNWIWRGVGYWIFSKHLTIHYKKPIWSSFRHWLNLSSKKKGKSQCGGHVQCINLSSVRTAQWGYFSRDLPCKKGSYFATRLSIIACDGQIGWPHSCRQVLLISHQFTRWIMRICVYQKKTPLL